LEEQDPPLPEYSKNIYTTCERYIKALMLKYELQSGRIKIDDWKKKLDELFIDCKKSKIMAAIETLHVEKKGYSIIEHSGKGLAWKEGAVAHVYEIIKEDLTKVVDNLNAMFEKCKRR